MGLSNNGILTAPFTKIALSGNGDLQKALNRTSCYSEIQLIGDINESQVDVDRIKIFAKYKPFRDTTAVFAFDVTKATPELRSPARWQAAAAQNYGLNPAPLLIRNQSTGVFEHSVWTYNKPTLPTYPLRALDFDGYYQNAVSPLHADMPGAIWYAGGVMNFRLILDPVGYKQYFNTTYCITTQGALGEQYHKKTSPGWYVCMVIYANQGNSGYVVSTISSGKTPKEIIDNNDGIWSFTWDVPSNYTGRTLTFQFCLANLPTAGEYSVDDYDPFVTGNAYSLEYEENDGRAVSVIQQNPGGVAALYNLSINAFTLHDTQDASLVHDIWIFDTGITANISANNNWDAAHPLSVYTTIRVENGSINNTDLDNPTTYVELDGVSLTIPADSTSHTYTIGDSTDLQRNYLVYIPKGQTAYVRAEAYGIDYIGNRVDFPVQTFILNP